jgi:hypothetical protein
MQELQAAAGESEKPCLITPAEFHVHRFVADRRFCKCDETQPGCRKCSSFGISCNYSDPNAPDLQTTYHGAIFGAPTKRLSQKQAGPMESCFFVGKVEVFEYMKPGLSCISDDGDSMIELDNECLGRLDRFITRTALSVGPPHTIVIFQSRMAELVCGVCSYYSLYHVTVY